MEIRISDEEVCNASRKVFLETGDFSASFISWLDRKVGFTTQLIKHTYNPLTFYHTFLLKRYTN